MATAADACANIQTETERETTTTKLKLKETGAEKTADIREIGADDVEEEYVEISKREQVDEEEEDGNEQEEEEDIEVLYDSLELPQIPAVKTSAVAALEQKLTKTAAAVAAASAASTANSETANQKFKVEVRVENVAIYDDEDEEVAKAVATKIDTIIANGEKSEDTEEFKREQAKQQDVVDYCKIKQLQQQLQKQREAYLMIDDIPEPIKVLDDIISEFEASSELKPAIGSVENQSEDDGYMSLSRKK